jgi:hypothetical protein
MCTFIFACSLDGVFDAETASDAQVRFWEAVGLSADEVAAVQAPGPSATAALSPPHPLNRRANVSYGSIPADPPIFANVRYPYGAVAGETGNEGLLLT